MTDKYEVVIKKNGKVELSEKTDCVFLACAIGDDQNCVVSLANNISITTAAEIYLSSIKAILKEFEKYPLIADLVFGVLLEEKNTDENTSLDLDILGKLHFTKSNKEEDDE